MLHLLLNLEWIDQQTVYSCSYRNRHGNMPWTEVIGCRKQTQNSNYRFWFNFRKIKKLEGQYFEFLIFLSYVGIKVLEERRKKGFCWTSVLYHNYSNFEDITPSLFKFEVIVRNWMFNWSWFFWNRGCQSFRQPWLRSQIIQKSNGTNIWVLWSFWGYSLCSKTTAKKFTLKWLKF